MKKGGVLDDTLGQVGNLGKQVGASFVKESKNIAQTAAKQVGLEHGEASEVKEKAAQPAVLEAQKGIKDKDTADFIKDLYGTTNESDKAKAATGKAQAAVNLAQSNLQKTPAEIQGIAALQQKLHKETYYDPTFNKPKQQEETVVQRVERQDEEEKKKRWELAKKEEKKKPIAVELAEKSTETHRGVNG